MIGFGLRLTLRGGSEAAIRLLMTAVAVALGVGLLLITLAGVNALIAQNDRAAWLNSGQGGGGPAGRAAPSADPLWWLLTTDQYASQGIDRVDVAATGPRSPVPPGIPHLPGPGQYYASPALSALLRTAPAARLRDRFPGHQIGTIGPAALPAPNSLIIVIGHTPRQLARAPGAEQVTSIQASAGGAPRPGRRAPPASVRSAGGHVAVGYDSTTLEIILAVGALALVFPVLIFISTATRLAAARREQRFAVIRLTGATPRQVSVISAVEASLSALAGVAAGFGLYLLLHPLLLAIPSFTGQPFEPGDLSLRLADILVVAIGVPVAAAVAARIAMRRLQISPLGVARRVTPPAPHAWRVIPLVLGIAELAYFAGAGHPNSTSSQILVYFLGFLLTMVGVVIAGPWLTMVGSQVLARHTSRPAALIAGRRLGDNPRAAFRSISGLIVALFITSVAVGITTTILADHGAPSHRGGVSDVLADSFIVNATASGQPISAAATVPGTVLARLRSIPAVHGVAVIHTDPGAATSPGQNQADEPGLVSCAQLARIPALGRCRAGAAVAPITVYLGQAGPGSSQEPPVWPAAHVSPQRLPRLPVETVLVGTNGSTAAIEQARTALEVAFPYLGPPRPLSRTPNQTTYGELQRLSEVVIVASLVIAGCSLAVSVTAGLTDRKRPFSLLRLTGAPLGLLRRVVVLESAAPLVVIALLSAGTGFLSSQLFLRSELSESLRPPGIAYYTIVLAGLAASLAVIAATFPLLDRITGPEVARNE
jgi:hypothetical protein